MKFDLPPPRDWQDFEDLCRDLWAELWGDPNAQKHGRTGQKQRGVDVFGQPAGGDGAWEGVQCKRYERQLTRREIKHEVDEAQKFKPPLRRLIVATTTKRDTGTQEMVRAISAAEETRGSFPVSLWSWDDIGDELAEHRDLLRRYYPAYAEEDVAVSEEVGLERYKQYVKYKNNTVRIFAMDRPQALREIYVKVNVIEHPTSRRRDSIKALEERFEANRRGLSIKKVSREGSDLADELERFVLLGRPGAGKTTFLKFLALQSLDGNTRKERIPIFVGLKEFSESDRPLVDYIVEQFEIANFPDAKPFLTRALREGGCQLLLDGLDEIGAKREMGTVQKIRYLVDKHRDNQFVVSCRFAAYNYWFPDFSDVELADFDDQQIQSFIDNWFEETPGVAGSCWRAVRNTPQIRELARTPLLLTLLCLAFDEEAGFPTSRADLYKEALEALLEKWDMSRHISRSQLYRELSLPKKAALFSQIAAEKFEKGQFFFPQEKLEEDIVRFMRNSLGVTDVDGRAIFTSIVVQHGLFLEQAKGVYSFSHLTLQEYFTAVYYVENSEKSVLERLIEYHLADEKWREVFLMVADLLENTETFLLRMARRIQALTREEAVAGFLRAASDIVRSESALANEKALLLAIFYLCQRFAPSYQRHPDFYASEQWPRALSPPRGAIDDIFSAIKNISGKIGLHIGGYTYLYYQGQVDYPLRNFDEDLRLKKVVAVDLEGSAALARDLAAYLRCSELLVDCLTASERVSKAGRERILREVFALAQ